MRFRVENVPKNDGVSNEDMEQGKDDEKAVRLRMVDLFTMLIIEYWKIKQVNRDKGRRCI